MRLFSILALMTCLPALAAPFDLCREASRKLLSASAQRHFLAADFLPHMFGELHRLVYKNRATVTNVEVNDLMLQRNDDGQTPRVVGLFEVAKTFDIQVAHLFEHVGNLESHINFSRLAQKLPFDKKQRDYIFERVRFSLSNVIDETLKTRDISLGVLALQTGINAKIFHAVMDSKGLPRLRLLLKILIELNVDVIDFFKRVETGLDLESVISSDFSESMGELVSQIDYQLEEILRGVSGEKGSDIEKFKSRIYFGLYRNRRSKEKASNSRKLTLEKILQTARMLGMEPSDVLQYSANLKLHARLEGVENRTLLSKEATSTLLEKIHRNLNNMIEESGMEIKELAAAIKLPDHRLKREVVGSIGGNLHYSTLEKILGVLDSDIIRFFEELEWSGKFDVHAPALASLKDTGKVLDTSMGERISRIREMLPFKAYKFDAVVAGRALLNEDLAQIDVHFKTLYKVSRVVNISLSDLVSERPVEGLFDPGQYSRYSKIEKIPGEDVERAKELLSHLIFSEFKRQNQVDGLSITDLAIKSHFFGDQIRKILLGGIPVYSNLRRIVEDGLGIPMPRFLKDFETKLDSFKHISKATKEDLVGLDGMNLNPGIAAKVKRVWERTDRMMSFLFSIKVDAKSLEEALGMRIFRRKNSKVRDQHHIQISATIKFCHLLGISMREFFGEKDFSELVKNKNQLNFEHLSNQQILQRVAEIKRNVDKRREELNISINDLGIMLGTFNDGEMKKSLSNQSVISFPWQKYFQLTEILAREGEDDFFLLDEIDL